MKHSETIIPASNARELLWEALAALNAKDTTAAIKAITKAIAILSVF